MEFISQTVIKTARTLIKIFDFRENFGLSHRKGKAKGPAMTSPHITDPGLKYQGTLCAFISFGTIWRLFPGNAGLRHFIRIHDLLDLVFGQDFFLANDL